MSDRAISGGEGVEKVKTRIEEKNGMENWWRK